MVLPSKYQNSSKKAAAVKADAEMYARDLELMRKTREELPPHERKRQEVFPEQAPNTKIQNAASAVKLPGLSASGRFGGGRAPLG